MNIKRIKPQLFTIIFLIGFFLLITFLLGNYLLFQTGKKSKATGETVTLSFNPSSVTASSGDFSTTIKAKPSVDILVRGYEFKVNFDKSKVQVKTISYRLGSVSSGIGDKDNITAINTNGYINIIGESQDSTGTALSSTQETEVAVITFTSNSASTSNISAATTGASFSRINPTDFQLIPTPLTGNASLAVNGTAATPTPPPGATATPTPPPGATATPTPLPTGTVQLNLKLKFQGIIAKPVTNTMNVRVKLGGIAIPTDYSTGTFTSDDKGIWSGTVSFNTVPGPGYIVYVKGPKHIQKKICATTPTETSPGSYHCGQGAITLANGANALDLSGVLQLGGDLPDQDGVVDSYDISLVRNNLGKADAEAVRLADLNLDGRVDTQDYSLMIAALSVRADEE